MLVAGIDIGSITTEALLFDKDKGILGYKIVQTGADSKKSAETALENVLAYPAKQSSDISYTVATGCGRKRAGFAQQSITEITCIARGVNYLFPGARTIIDIGGQDTKVIRIDEKGVLLNSR
jgi:activator of 2-hydroxyglutaryl-CoA dehydratase